MKRVVLISSLQALAAAFLFGMSAPLSKMLLGDIEPIPLAGFLYLGSGMGVLFWLLLRRKTSDRTRRDAPLQKANLPWLAGAVATGGVIAPLLLLFGLRATPAASASLLLNFEGVATTIIAALIFGEAVGRRIWLSVFTITIASILLTVDTSGDWGITLGALGVLAACVFWGMDNNLTRNIAAKNPL
ncbi:MAG TPA: EamA family transporter, partial [Chloroflexi bacterium]|nr:EamA family transporter [Chloroflexota bacterium]